MSVAWSDAVTALPGAAAALVPWRAQGQIHLTVVAKATFAFAEDAAMTPVDPQEIVRAEVHHGNNPVRSIRVSSDLAPRLPRVDVVFTGHAHAPPAGRATAALVRIAVFTHERAFLDRTLRVEDRAGFDRLPLVYERALGGMSVPDNPLGVATPSIVDPQAPDRPAGFGPIARAWPVRKALLGSTPRKVLDGNIAEIPDGFDWSYYQAAPAEQRLDDLAGDEWILLAGLHPTPLLRMRLPGARGRARLHGLSAFGVAEGHGLDLRLDTIRIDGDEERCTLVWRESVVLPSEAALDQVQVVAGVELPAAPLAWADPPRERRAPRPAAAPTLEGPSATLALGVEDAARFLPATPFQPAPAGAGLAAQLPPRAPVEHVPSGTLSLPGEEVVVHASLRAEIQAAARPSPAPATYSPWAAGAPKGGLAPAPSRETAAPAPVPPAAVLAMGALAASNAAAGAQPAIVPAVEAAPAARDEDAEDAREVLDLIWFDPACLPRARKHAVWQPILDALAEAPPDPDIDAPDLDPIPARGEERREVFEILVQAPASDGAALRAALKAAVRADRKFVAPLALLSGALSFLFDPAEKLSALASALAPLAGDDDPLKSAAASAAQTTGQPRVVPAALEAIAARLGEAYAQGKRAVPLSTIQAQVEETLLEHRRYLRRAVFGGRHLAGRLALPDEEGALPIYVPEAVADALPLAPSFRVRLIVEAHLSPDPRDQHPVALRAVALARSAAPAHRW
jgi:hypothetical protein